MRSKQQKQKGAGEEEREITVGGLERVGGSRELGEGGESFETHREKRNGFHLGALTVTETGREKSVITRETKYVSAQTDARA